MGHVKILFVPLLFSIFFPLFKIFVIVLSCYFLNVIWIALHEHAEKKEEMSKAMRLLRAKLIDDPDEQRFYLILDDPIIDRVRAT